MKRQQSPEVLLTLTWATSALTLSPLALTILVGGLVAVVTQWQRTGCSSQEFWVWFLTTANYSTAHHNHVVNELNSRCYKHLRLLWARDFAPGYFEHVSHGINKGVCCHRQGWQHIIAQLLCMWQLQPVSQDLITQSLMPSIYTINFHLNVNC